MRRLRLRSSAEADYLQAISWYEEQRPGLGREFETELEEVLQRIRQNPEFFARQTATVRKARMPRFKYGIFFTVENDEIGVLAIYHPSRNPDALRTRF
jgi:plasmid stabilization system protein ParE